MRKYYDILSVRHDASPTEIREAYRDLVKVWHPDRFRNENQRLQERANEKLKEINEAFDEIKKAGFQYEVKSGKNSSNEQKTSHENRNLIRCPQKSCTGYLNSNGYCFKCGRIWRKKQEDNRKKEYDIKEKTSSSNKPQKGDLVCGNCGYIVGVTKPPKHSFLGVLTCPECNGKKFYRT